ncbi:DUF1419 domain-containing protein [Mesorhizobium sp. PL10]
MPSHPPFRKVFDGVATREQMFELFNRHRDVPGVDPLSGTPYAGEWFQISSVEYHSMLELLPPLFQRTGMFGISEYKAKVCHQRLLCDQGSRSRTLVPRVLRPVRQTQSGRDAGRHRCS